MDLVMWVAVFTTRCCWSAVACCWRCSGKINLRPNILLVVFPQQSSSLGLTFNCHVLLQSPAVLHCIPALSLLENILVSWTWKYFGCRELGWWPDEYRDYWTESLLSRCWSESSLSMSRSPLTAVALTMCSSISCLGTSFLSPYNYSVYCNA